LVSDVDLDTTKMISVIDHCYESIQAPSSSS
jgi:hypothetical protein